MPWILAKPVVDVSVKGLCVRPYPGHPRGCPNFNKRSTCPPKCATIDKIINLDRAVYAIFNVFDFGGHVAKMRLAHPNWSGRQLQCCLYWQPSARKMLRNEVKDFLNWNSGFDGIIVYTPEALGVNITATMASIGENLEWPPKTVTYQVALAGYKNESNSTIH